MKFKTTSKQIKNNYDSRFIWQCGYCELQSIFKGVSPIAYTCGVYGWNYDLFIVEGVAFTTGYRSMIGREIPYDLIKRYNKKVAAIDSKYSWGEYEKKLKAMERLRKSFIKALYKV